MDELCPDYGFAEMQVGVTQPQLVPTLPEVKIGDGLGEAENDTNANTRSRDIGESFDEIGVDPGLLSEGASLDDTSADSLVDRTERTDVEDGLEDVSHAEVEAEHQAVLKVPAGAAAITPRDEGYYVINPAIGPRGKLLGVRAAGYSASDEIPADLRYIARKAFQHFDTVREARDCRQFSGGSQPVGRELEALAELHDALVDIGDSLGVPEIRNRLPQFTDYHIFDSSSDYTVARLQCSAPVLNNSKPSVAQGEIGSYFPRVGILLNGEGRPFEKRIGDAGHETAHSVGAVVTRTALRPDGSIGIQNGDGYTWYSSVADEIGANLLAARALHEAGLPPPTTYVRATIIGTVALQHTANVYGVNTAEIGEVFEAGRLKGDGSGLTALRNAIGEQQIQALWNMPTAMTTNRALQTIRLLGLPQALFDRASDMLAQYKHNLLNYDELYQWRYY
jgi:hypothetical protein